MRKISAKSVKFFLSYSSLLTGPLFIRTLCIKIIHCVKFRWRPLS